MPELPEVETVCRELNTRLRDAPWKVASVSTHPTPRWSGPNHLSLGQQLAAVTRRGKYLILEADAATSTGHRAAGTLTTGAPDRVLLHLGMSGVLDWATTPPEQGPHERVRIRLRSSGKTAWLRLTDPRGFGGAWWWPAGSPEPDRVAQLGPEPLATDFTADVLADRLRGARAVKAALLDQKVLVGVGNIYADEALWAAGIHPLQPAGTLTPTQVAALHRSLVAALTAGIRNGGTTLRDYRRTDGSTGTNQRSLAVYGRAGEPCVRCSAPLTKSVVAGRGTTSCPHCQAPPASMRHNQQSTSPDAPQGGGTTTR